jgi:hypothetical protein
MSAQRWQYALFHLLALEWSLSLLSMGILPR